MATCKMNFNNHQNVNIPQLPPEKDYHVFVCYVSENVNEVRMIVENLEKGGIKCCYHERDFTPGHGIFDNMRDKINASVHMLVVLSEDFSKSSFALHELKEAFHRQIREDFSIIPLKIEPCDVPDILENKTYIDCENDEITNIHHTIIEAVIENGLKTQMKEDDSGKVITISLSQQSRFPSLPRYKLECDHARRLEITKKTKLTDEDIDAIEKIANQSLFMKNLHIHDFFPRITCLLIFILLLFCLVVMMILVYTVLGRSRADSASGGFAIMLVSIILAALTIILFVGCLCLHFLEFGSECFMDMAFRAVQRQLWSFNRHWQKKDAVVIFQTELFLYADTAPTLEIIIIKFSRCKDLFIRKCEQREELQNRRLYEEPVNDYADRMFSRFLCSYKIRFLNTPRSGKNGHSMLNGAQCICSLLKEDLLKDT